MYIHIRIHFHITSPCAGLPAHVNHHPGSSCFTRSFVDQSNHTSCLYLHAAHLWTRHNQANHTSYWSSMVTMPENMPVKLLAQHLACASSICIGQRKLFPYRLLIHRPAGTHKFAAMQTWRTNKCNDTYKWMFLKTSYVHESWIHAPPNIWQRFVLDS